jgi:hypothetical protein
LKLLPAILKPVTEASISSRTLLTAPTVASLVLNLIKKYPFARIVPDNGVL